MTLESLRTFMGRIFLCSGRMCGVTDNWGLVACCLWLFARHDRIIKNLLLLDATICCNQSCGSRNGSSWPASAGILKTLSKRFPKNPGRLGTRRSNLRVGQHFGGQNWQNFGINNKTFVCRKVLSVKKKILSPTHV